jgi:DNA-binding FadR family transcriptional regulator
MTPAGPNGNSPGTDTTTTTKMVARTVRVPKMAELVAADLRRQIVRGDLEEGDALPSENVLMEQFGVSRPTLREAFRVLESEALITVRRGARGGARVHPPKGDVAARYAGLVLQYRGATLADTYEARTVIEPYCAGLLASRRTKADLEALWQNVEEAEDALKEDPNRFIRKHTDFHALVVRLAGNETLQILDEMLHHILEIAHWSKTANDAGTPTGDRVNHKGARAHRRLVELIEAMDADGATELWRKHLAEADRYLQEGPIAKTVLDLLT